MSAHRSSIREKASRMLSPRSSGYSKSRTTGDIACIFVHAGAGFHSKDNEAYHLQACNDACKAGMVVMKAGGSSIDAVEVAIKVLEDREITNAGYGSNLGFDRIVECDAILVDHFGRSGAAGAVAQIKNPISLARLLLDHSTKALSLRRVPPNLLVGQGAAQFANEHGMDVVSYKDLISPFAKHRWQKWRADLEKAERHKRRQQDSRNGSMQLASEDHLEQFCDEQDFHEDTRRVHEKGMLAAMYNDAQPISPPPSDSPDRLSSQGRTNSAWSVPVSTDTKLTTPDRKASQDSDPFADRFASTTSLQKMAHHPFANSTQQITPNTSYTRLASTAAVDGGQQQDETSDDDLMELDDGDSGFIPVTSRPHPWSEATTAIETEDAHLMESPRRRRGSTVTVVPAGEATSSPKSQASYFDGTSSGHAGVGSAAEGDKRGDHITDTVGVIAIDNYGNIAAGASSGGIGMKHRGRVGPAALIGVGAHVIPVDEDDEEQTTVATVTSGTGEHMNTTMAASVCSDRLLRNVRKLPGGHYEEVMEDQALRNFIEKDFMGHPSVKHSDSTGAIGTLTVKKTSEGVWMFFGHNTDSFALASFHSDEKVPVCTMSRSASGSSIAQGGRAVRFRRKK